MVSRPDLAVPATRRGASPSSLEKSWAARIKPTSPLAAYVGGKRHLAKRLVPLIESIPHKLYAEPFVGMGGVFLRRTARADIEVINDGNGDLANLFRIAQRHPEALAAEMRFKLHSRGQWDTLARQASASLTDIERAARFLCLQKSAFGGKVTDQAFAMTKVGGSTKAYDRRDLAARLDALHARLARVTIENLPFPDFLTRYDGPGVLFFADPPYWGSEDYYGPGMFSKADFTVLRDTLASLKGRFILTLNDAPQVRELFAGFAMESVGVTYGISGTGSTAAKELIITNG